jgi:hypothetical protein
MSPLMDLAGGGVIRSHGGWAAVKAMGRAKEFRKSDESILGDGDFVKRWLPFASTIQVQTQKEIPFFKKLTCEPEGVL